ncbi:MAG: WecB/TagA/CpsF family glycosyltransferase [Desulfobacterales bacterium]|nr:MAG: WecB/TagA/CpsF family glycosyltransferase [Desulfobacterales bacterium]
MRVDATNYQDATKQVMRWAAAGDSRYVCIANVHMTMEAFDRDRFRRIVNRADLVTPDGMPLVLTLRLLGIKRQTRVYGPTLTLHVCKAAAQQAIPVGLYGGNRETVEKLVPNLKTRFPELQIVYAYSPPFRPLTAEEDAAVVTAILASQAKILFVGLGCPKQEHWMAEHLGRIKAVMIGVGAAFDFHAGTIRQAPDWIMRLSLEWLYRLLMEPERLWRRYLYNNPRYVFLVGSQLLRLRKFDE